MIAFRLKYNYYSRVAKQLKHRDNIFKENMDMEIKRSLQKGTVPFFKRLYEKAENNKHKIGLFVALIVSLNLEPIYTCKNVIRVVWKLYVPPLEIRKALRESLAEPKETNFKSKV